MAWVLAGLGIGMGVSYLASSAKEMWDDTTKPFYDKLEKERQDSDERLKEDIRQQQIERKKTGFKARDVIIGKYNIEKHCGIIKLFNNSDHICWVIFVNHYNAKNKDDAIVWAMKNIRMDYFDGQLLNKINTKKICLGVNNEYEMIQNEIDEYFVVLCVDGKFMVLSKNNIDRDTIKVKNVFELKYDNGGVDLGCKKWGW
jgi:hypothetical protein